MTHGIKGRAAPIIAANPDATLIEFIGHYVRVKGVTLDVFCDEDREVLRQLMANDEFGFAVTSIEETPVELRHLQNDPPLAQVMEPQVSWLDRLRRWYFQVAKA